MTAGADHLLNLYERLRRSWSTETRRHWCPDRPASGQCGVTAPVVHDEPGGRILKTDVNGLGTSTIWWTAGGSISQ